MQPSPKFIVVIGASAGGSDALRELLLRLKATEDVAVLVVLHISGKAISDFLVLRLRQYTSLHCKIAENGEVIRGNHIYIAPADRHLLVKKGRILLGGGPVENRWRPSIDVLFRSAAVAYTTAVIGIVLTGLLDDGTAGMWAIQRSGGTCIVQDPDEAEFPDMPLSVLNNMKVDYCVPLAKMGAVIDGLVKNKKISEATAPADIIAEADIAERVATDIGKMEEIGEQTVYSCPSCGGGLWKIHDGHMERYRCHVGHAFTESDLCERQEESMENTLWVALRIMEERRNLLTKMSKDERKRGLHSMAGSKEQRLKELHMHIGRLKEMLFNLQKEPGSAAQEP